MTRHEKNLVKRAEKFDRCNEYRHDQTGQRKFERSFESRDLEESEAAIEGENAANEVLASVGRRDISLRSPADIAMLRLDLEHWEAVLRCEKDRRLMHVFRPCCMALRRRISACQERHSGASQKKLKIFWRKNAEILTWIIEGHAAR